MSRYRGDATNTSLGKVLDRLAAVETDATKAPDFRRLCSAKRQHLMAATSRVTRLRGEKRTAEKAVERLVRARRPNSAPMSVQEADARRKIVEAEEADADIDKAIAQARELLTLWGAD